MSPAEYSKDPQNHRSAVEVAKSYIDRSHEKYDREPKAGETTREYYKVLSKLNSSNNGIDDATKKNKVEIKIGSHSSFTEAASQAMYNETYTKLPHEKRNIILNLYLILASQGFEMNRINSNDSWELDFKEGKFKGTLGGKTIEGNLEYLDTAKEREDIIKQTRGDLATLKSRLTAEAQAILEGKSGAPENLQGALDTGSLVYILKTLENDNVSYESRMQLLKDRAKAFKESPDIEMANEIAGINYYLGQWKVADQFINPDTGEGYKGTREQNKAWVQVIKDIVKEKELPVYMRHGYMPAEGVPAPAQPTQEDAAEEMREAGARRTGGENLTEEDREIVGEPDGPAPEVAPEEAFDEQAQKAHGWVDNHIERALRTAFGTTDIAIISNTFEQTDSGVKFIYKIFVNDQTLTGEAEFTKDDLGALKVNENGIMIDRDKAGQVADKVYEKILVEKRAEIEKILGPAPAPEAAPKIPPAQEVLDVLDLIGGNKENHKKPFKRETLDFEFIAGDADTLDYKATTREGFPVTLRVDEFGVEVSYNVLPGDSTKMQLKTVEIDKNDKDGIGLVIQRELRIAIANAGRMEREGVVPATGEINSALLEARQEKKALETRRALKNVEKLGVRNPENLTGSSFRMEKVTFTWLSGKPGQADTYFEGAVHANSILQVIVVNNPIEAGVAYKIHFKMPLVGNEGNEQTREYATLREFKKDLKLIRDRQKDIEDMHVAAQGTTTTADTRLLESSPLPGEAHPMEPGFAQALEAIGGNRENYTQNIQLNGIPELTFEYKEFSWTGLERPIQEGDPDEKLKGTVNSAYYRVEKDGILYTLRVVEPGKIFEDRQFGRQDKAYKLRIVSASSGGAPGGIKFDETQNYDNADAVSARLREVLGQVEAAKNRTEGDFGNEGIPAAPGESAPPSSDDSPEAEALAAALEENPLPPSAQKILKEVLRIDNAKAPFEFGGFTFNYQGAMGTSEMFYVGSRNNPDLKLNIFINGKGVAAINLGGTKVGAVRNFPNASALERFLEGLSK